MRNLLTVCAALVVMLGIVSGNLWYELRSARQLIADLQDQQTQTGISVARSAQVQAPPATIDAPTIPAGAAQLPELPPRPAVPREPTVPNVLPSVSHPLTTGSEEARRADALVQSDRAAASRVRAWSSVLGLTPEQLQALNTIAIAELRHETEQSLEIDSRTGPMDALAAARVKEETINRQHETNLRILERITPQLTSEQSSTLRGMFEGWIKAQMARVERERVAASGN